MAELRRAWDDSHVSGETYTELIDSYAAQEGTSRSIVHDDVLAYIPNPTPSVSVADLRRALTDTNVTVGQYGDLINRYAEQEHITRGEAHRRAHNYEAQDLPEPHPQPEPSLSTEWFVFDEMAGVDVEGQGNEAAGLSTPTVLVSEAGIDILAPTVLDGSQPVEPTPPGERWGVIGRSPMDRLRSAIPSQYVRFYVDWANEPERTTEPFVSVDRGLSEQEVQRIREAIYQIEDSAFTGTWLARPDPRGDMDISGVRSQDTEHNSPTETEGS
jgi:hypothetical protein